MLETTSGSLDPNLNLGSKNKQRYPNPFFDISQQYMPPTIKELFKWCTFYYYNSPLVGSTITKISRYPITDIIFEDSSDKIRDLWEKVFVHDLKMKTHLMEINLDYHVYGNAFVSVHLPFTRFLICNKCNTRNPIKGAKWDWDSGTSGFRVYCDPCGAKTQATAKDVPHKNLKEVQIIRWSPENINVKFNDFTGKRYFMYSVPNKLRSRIYRGDKDILAETPLIVLEAIKSRKYIRFSDGQLFHLRRPTLAEQDQGWGKPLIIHVLKDLYYYYVLRRAQEAVAHEHILPLDILYPMPNAQQDPYIHTDLASWKRRVEELIVAHRRDQNFKGVAPIPIGHERIGGDGKMLLLTPELNYLNQTIVGGMGIPQEFLFGGLTWSGSSVSLRTLENDFIQNRTQLLDLVYWIKNKIKVWFAFPNIQNIKFADFRMADDVQKNQQLIGLNAQYKVSDQTMLTELGYDYDQEVKKMVEEAYLQNYLNDLRSKGAAKSQGEAGIIQFNYQQKVQELAEKAQRDAMEKANKLMLAQKDRAVEPHQIETSPETGVSGAGSGLEASGAEGGDLGMPPAMPEGGPEMAFSQAPGIQAPAAQGPTSQNATQVSVQSRVNRWASNLAQLPTQDAHQTLTELNQQMPDIGRAVEQRYNEIMQQQSAAPVKDPNMSASAPPSGGALPEQKPPRRQGGV